MRAVPKRFTRAFAVLVASGIAALALVPAALAAIPAGPFTGDLGASGTTQTGGISLASTSTCNAAPSATPQATGSPKYSASSFVNDSGSDSCVAVTYTATANVMVAAYTGSFDPSSPSTNFAGGPATTGSCGGTSGSFTVRVNNAETFVIVVSECTPGAGGQFSFTLAARPRTVTIDSTMTADAATVQAGSQAGFTIQLINAGDVDFDSVAWTDALPSGPGIDWSLASDSSAGWAISGTAPNQSLTFPADFLAASTTSTAHLVTATSTASCGLYTNTFEVTVTGESTQASDGKTASLTVTCDASQQPSSEPSAQPSGSPLPSAAPSNAPSSAPSGAASSIPSADVSLPPATSFTPEGSVGGIGATQPATDALATGNHGDDATSAAIRLGIAVAGLVSAIAILVRPQRARRR